MRRLDHQRRREDVRTQTGRWCAVRKLSRNGTCVVTDFAHSAFRVRRVLVSLSLLLLCGLLCPAEEAPFRSATIAGLGARNRGSATMTGRNSAISGTREPAGTIPMV